MRLVRGCPLIPRCDVAGAGASPGRSKPAGRPRFRDDVRSRCDVTFTIFELIEVQLYDFTETGIIFALGIEIDSDGTTLSFESSYGMHGRITAKRVVISFEARPVGSS